jgi:hypothetical protein
MTDTKFKVGDLVMRATRSDRWIEGMIYRVVACEMRTFTYGTPARSRECLDAEIKPIFSLSDIPIGRLHQRTASIDDSGWKKVTLPELGKFHMRLSNFIQQEMKTLSGEQTSNE